MPVFIESKEDIALDFEKNIAYFYGANETDSIAKPYIKALETLEAMGVEVTESELRKNILPHLKQAYLSVQQQTQRQFNVDIASDYEFQLIIAQAKSESFEEIYSIMKKLYQEVFQIASIHIHKAAMLRSFLYKYKISLLKMDALLSSSDMQLMVAIAKSSEDELSLASS